LKWLNSGPANTVLLEREPTAFVPESGGSRGDGRVHLQTGETMNARQIFFFDSMLTPKIITFVYWLSLVGVVVGGLVTMFAGRSFVSFLMGLVVIAGGAIATRIYCELLIVLFKIHENIRKLAEKA